ncbi:MAG: MlaD family protein [Motiliproteus sp.]
MSGDKIATAVEDKPSGISVIWIVPLMALLAAGWLGYRAWQQTGPTIDIAFVAASGIAVGKTEIRFKDVKIGLVNDVSLDKDLQQVRVSAEMEPIAASHISENSRFWVVQPRVSLSGISGLNTLLSGVYIQMDPGAAGASKRSFIGLDEPPEVNSIDKGSVYTLHAEALASLDIGSPVYYRQIRVGDVTGYKLADDGNSVEVRVFVNAPHDQLIKTNSRFWNISGFGMELNAQGLKANMASLASLISGGIAFDTPLDTRQSIAEMGHHFNLFSDEKSVEEQAYTLKYSYLMNFTGSVRGLAAGAPVEYRGIKVGQVEQIRFIQNNDRIQVLVTLEPQRLDLQTLVSRTGLDEALQRIIKTGMRAQLKTGNMITGALYVDLVQQSVPGGELIMSAEYPEIPTVEGQFEQLARQLNGAINKINQFPLEDIGQELLGSLKSLRIMLAELKAQRVTAKVDGTLANLQSASGKLDETITLANEAIVQVDVTLKSLDKTIDPDSELHYQALRLIDQLTKASSAFRELAEELNRNPNALLFGKEKR